MFGLAEMRGLFAFELDLSRFSVWCLEPVKMGDLEVERVLHLDMKMAIEMSF